MYDENYKQVLDKRMSNTTILPRTHADIFSVTLGFMLECEQARKMTGPAKKAVVIQKLVEAYGGEDVATYMPLIESAIEFIKYAARNKHILDGLVTSSCSKWCVG